MFNCVSVVQAWRQWVNWAWLGQTWPVGPTGQWHSAGQGHWQVGPVNVDLTKVKADTWGPQVLVLILTEN